MKIKLDYLVKLHDPLKETDTVIDCGGYLGWYTDELLKLYDCHVKIFEPVKEFAEICKKKFKDNPRVGVATAGISDHAGRADIYVKHESSSLYKHLVKSNKIEKINLLRATDVVRDFKPKILKLNCEGEEYNIITDLFVSGELANIDEILVQFHRSRILTKNEARRMLSDSHKRVYDFKWELWKKK